MKAYLFLLLCLLCCACDVADNQKLVCSDDGIGHISGQITEGKTLLAGSDLVLPYKVTVILTTDVYIDKVTIGGAPARLADPATESWEALLSQVDLEKNRGMDDKAVLKVMAFDGCQVSHEIDQAEVALGPAPNIAVSNLALAAEIPGNECYVPTGGGVSPVIRVTASLPSAGAKVTVATHLGELGNGSSSQELTLATTGDHAQATAFFVPPQTPGIAQILASGRGATAAPLTVRVFDRPAIDAPTTSLQPGLVYNGTVSTQGNLESCLVEETIAGAATVSIIEPQLGAITGTKDVRQAPASCDTLERLRVSVQFTAVAPQGAAVTLRCFDTYGRDSSKTFTLAPPPPP